MKELIITWFVTISICATGIFFKIGAIGAIGAIGFFYSLGLTMLFIDKRDERNIK